MSQADRLLELFKTHGNRLYLGDILAAYDLIGSKYTNRISEARDALKPQGFTIVCHKNAEVPTKNLYEIVPIQGELFQ